MKFINDPTCKIIIANPRSGGVGVDGFQDVSSHVVFAEVCPFPGVFQQSIDRLHRTGQQAESVNVYILVPSGTISVKLRNDLVKKDYQQELAVRDKRAVLTELMGGSGISGSLDSLSYLLPIDKRQEAA
jgi:SNF2 family DNA or RNA helicase